MAHRRYRILSANHAGRAKGVAAWLRKVEGEWPRLSVESIGGGVSGIRLGDEILVTARVMLKSLSPDEVAVQVLTGLVDSDGSIKDPVVVPMRLSEPDNTGAYLFQAVLQPSARSGLHGYANRRLPNHLDSVNLFLPGLIKWAQLTTPVAGLQAR